MPTPPPTTSVKGSRERRKVGLAPLKTVTAPSRLGLTLMGLVTMLVGLGIWLLFWFGDAQPPTGPRKWGSALFASLFFLFGLRLAVEGVRLQRRWRLRRFRDSTEPWGEGYRWARTMDPLAGPPTGWLKGCVGGLALLAFVVAINMVWLDLGAVRGSRLLAYGLIPLATAVILLVLVSGLWQGVKSIRFGRARLRLVDYPAAPGGPLRAVLTTTNRLPAEGIVESTLARVEETPQAGEAPGRFAPTVEIMHSFVRRSEISTCSEGGHEVSLAFDLPPDVPPTLLHGPDGSRRYWVLEGRGTRRPELPPSRLELPGAGLPALRAPDANDGRPGTPISTDENLLLARFEETGSSVGRSVAIKRQHSGEPGQAAPAADADPRLLPDETGRRRAVRARGPLAHRRITACLRPARVRVCVPFTSIATPAARITAG